ncbi:MAG: Ig-like domain-containing protein [Gemmatimonadaceae bacterium]
MPSHATRIAVTTLLSLLAVACQGIERPVQPKAAELWDLQVTPDSATMRVRDTIRFVARPLSIAGPVDSVVTWRSARPDIATVSMDGVVTGHAVGTDTIWATAGSITRSRVVRVTSPIVGMSVCAGWLASSSDDAFACSDSISVPPGWSTPIILLLRHEDGATHVLPSASLTVKDTRIATLINYGSDTAPAMGVVARARGTTLLHASYGAFTATARVFSQPQSGRMTVAVLPSISAKSIRLESWAMDGTPPDVFIDGQFPIATNSSIDLMFAGLEWSPNGRELLFSSGPEGLAVMREDRSSAWTFHAPADGVYTPSWTDDGTILFSTESGAVRRIQPRDPSSTVSELALVEPAWHVRMAGSGSLLYSCAMEDPFYARSDSSVCIQDKSGARVLLKCGNNPDWSPDGTQVASVCGTIDVTQTGDGQTRSMHLPGELVEAFAARWSPNGQSLAILSYGWSIWIVNADGSRPLNRSPDSGQVTSVAWRR